MEEKGQGGGVGHPSPPLAPGEHVHLLLMQEHRARVFRRDFGFGKQNTVESKVRLAPFVCLPWKHWCVLQEAGLKGYGSLCWAHGPSGPQPDPAAWQNSPWGTAVGMSISVVRSKSWLDVVCRGTLPRGQDL